MRQRLSLANRYRPLTFASVIGQQAACSALSRAAAEDRLAPAYLLSGTRGVGKTTIARIFARALNCEKGPAEEPCNACSQCLKNLSGNHVDVCEIDGASNTGVDDVRALRDNLGFMPMQGRYRIFIIDEAHMLSKSAFNALLKTLEEPPAHTVFIFATTEAHRFPATIISRCQHFVFRHLPEDEIFTHLADVMGREKIDFDEMALRLIAKRAAGSVRDSMSLLDQSLSLAGGRLDQRTVRESLGLAGPEFFNKLFFALPRADTAQIVELCAELLHSGADIGYFLRELAGLWRNLFLYRQTRGTILGQLNLSPDERVFIEQFSQAFPLAQLHAAWQMTLDSQRSIALSPEPGTALELLLLNLALLPQLLSPGSFVENASNSAEKADLKADEKKKLIEKILPPAQTESFSCEEDKGKFETGWEAFCKFCQNECKELEPPPRDILAGLDVDWQTDKIRIKPQSSHIQQRLKKKKQAFENAIKQFCGDEQPQIIYLNSDPQKSSSALLAECKNLPEVLLCQEVLGATLKDCRARQANAPK